MEAHATSMGSLHPINNAHRLSREKMGKELKLGTLNLNLKLPKTPIL